ncbi:MAG: peptidoglycan-binding protein [Hyphomicrobiales bacterium]
MTSPKAWSVKGVDAKTRQMVKDQAKESGVTMGEWLSDAVNMAVMEEFDAQQYQTEQHQPEEYEEQQMTGTGGYGQMFSNLVREYPNARPDVKNTNNTQQNTNNNAYQSADNMRNSRVRTKATRNQTAFNRPAASYAPRPEEHITNGFNVIENALTDIVDHIELADGHNSSALRDMQAQIAELNERTLNQPEPEVYSFHNEFNDMEGRLANLADRIDELNDNSSLEEPMVQEADNQDKFMQNTMLSRFDELFVKLDNISHQQTNYTDGVQNLEQGVQGQLDKMSATVEQSQTNSGAHGQDIDVMEQKLVDLSNRLEVSLEDTGVDPQIAELEEQIGGLSQKLSDLLSAPKPEYSPVPTKPVQSAETSAEITELRESIHAINERLGKTEDRLGGIDRLEDNMTKLIESVVDIRANSHQVAQDAANAAVSAFSKSQDDAIVDVVDLQEAEDIDALIAAKFQEISSKNDDAEKIQISGFKTVETSLEKIMNRLSQVEDAQNAAHAAPPPERPHEELHGEQDFIQPGADTKAEQPQDITAEISKTTTIAAKPAPLAQAVISEPPVELALPTQAPIAPVMSNTATAPTEIVARETVVIETAAIEPIPEIATETIQEALIPELTTAILETNDQVGSETAEERPVAQPSSSTDFIAAARRAAQQSYETEKGSDEEVSKTTSLFGKIKKAAKKGKNLTETATEKLSELPTQLDEALDLGLLETSEPEVAEEKVEEKTEKKAKKKFSLPKLGFKKKAKELEDEPQSDFYTSELPTDIFEEDFFKTPDDSASTGMPMSEGNELSLEAKDDGTFSDKVSRKGAAPVVIALFLVTVLISGVSWYSLRGTSPTPAAKLAQNGNNQVMSPADAATLETAARKTAIMNRMETNTQGAANQATKQNNAARAILDSAKSGLTTQMNGTSKTDTFSPEEFEGFNNSGSVAHQPTVKQIEALKNDDVLVTNSIPGLSTKPYTTSLLGNNSKFSKVKDASRMGSSSLSKSPSLAKPLPQIKQTPKLPEVKSGVAQASLELPTRIGPKLLRQNAQMGQAAEQFEVANRYALGYGVDIDLAKSFDWFMKAAGNKLAVAQFSVGMMREHGKGTSRNLSLAREYYQRAAEQGNLMSIYRLAMMNAAPQNPTTKPDFKVALRWFNMAANAGLVDAQYNLAVLYEKGHGTDVDLVETYKWYSIAAQKGDVQAQKRAKVIKLELSASQIVKAQAAVKAWSVIKLPENANSAPKLAYLKNEVQDGDAKLSQSKHVRSGALANDVIADKKSIKDTQTMLETLGWNVGGIDGVMGSKTRKAIKEFQTRHNLIITGEVNDELLANLEAATL